MATPETDRRSIGRWVTPAPVVPEAPPETSRAEEHLVPDVEPAPESQPLPGTGRDNQSGAGEQWDGQGGGSWRPARDNLAGQDWYANQPLVDTVAPEPLRADAGVTAVSGRVARLDGRPLAGATVAVDGVRTVTDQKGRFLLSSLQPGHRVLRVDGGTAGTGDSKFGLYDIGVNLSEGQTELLPYPIWLTELDTEHTVSFASPTEREVTISTPAIPGLEVRLPEGSVVRDVDGNVVTELGITAIPVDRAPFPLPRAQVPTYFTVQPGGASLFPSGAQIIYPNYTGADPGTAPDRAGPRRSSAGWCFAW